MYHFLYKTTNNITGQYYYGVHSTKNINDRYFGSGIRLKNNLGKYGRANFTRDIIQVFDSGREALVAEANLVTGEVLNDPLCLNLTIGGHGQSYLSGLTVAGKISRTAVLLGIRPSREAIMKSANRRRGVSLSADHCKRLSERSRRKKHTEEELKRMSESMKKWHNNNSSYMLGKSQTDYQKHRAKEAMHGRWHLSRDITNQLCEFCTK